VREGVNDILVFTQDRDLYCSKMVSLCHLQVLLLSCLLLRFAPVHGFLNATEDAKALVIANDHLYASVNKSTGIMDVLTSMARTFSALKSTMKLLLEETPLVRMALVRIWIVIVFPLERIRLANMRHSSFSAGTIRLVSRMVVWSCLRCIL
jgi:hypothetical protein